MIARYGVTRRRARPTAVRPAAGLLAAGAVLAALAGCGGGSSPQPAFTPAGGQGSSSGPGSGGQAGSETAAQVITVEKGSSSTITTKLDIISINQPVNVTLPPPSQVASPPASLGTSI